MDFGLAKSFTGEDDMLTATGHVAVRPVLSRGRLGADLEIVADDVESAPGREWLDGIYLRRWPSDPRSPRGRLAPLRVGEEIASFGAHHLLLSRPP